MELADELIERLKDFSPAVSISPGEDDDQVQVEITMSRRPYTRAEMAALVDADPEMADSAADWKPYAYRALIKRGSGPGAGPAMHLIREDAEASLCGIPRVSLTTSGIFDELVCPDCIEWLPKRKAFSERHPKVETPGA